jgi:hypothetical protein
MPSCRSRNSRNVSEHLRANLRRETREPHADIGNGVRLSILARQSPPHSHRTKRNGASKQRRVLLQLRAADGWMAERRETLAPPRRGRRNVVILHDWGAPTLISVNPHASAAPDRTGRPASGDGVVCVTAFRGYNDVALRIAAVEDCTLASGPPPEVTFCPPRKYLI